MDPEVFGSTKQEWWMDEALSVQEICGRLDRTGAKVKVLVFDCCRDRAKDDLVINRHLPKHAKAVTGGGVKTTIAEINSSELATNTLVIQSAGEGAESIAADPSSTQLSVFTEQFVDLMRKPGLDHNEFTERLTKQVRTAVNERKDSDLVQIVNTTKTIEHPYARQRLKPCVSMRLCH